MTDLSNIIEELHIQLEKGRPYGLVSTQLMKPSESYTGYGCLCPIVSAVLWGGAIAAYTENAGAISLGALFGFFVGNQTSPFVADLIIGLKTKKEEKKYFGSIENYLGKVEEYITTTKIQKNLPVYLQEALKIDAIPYFVVKQDVKRVEEIILSLRETGNIIYEDTPMYRAPAYRLLTDSLLLYEEKNIAGSDFLRLYDKKTSKDTDTIILHKSAETLVYLVKQKKMPLEAKALNCILGLEG